MAAAACMNCVAHPAVAATLSERLGSRDAKALAKPILNLAPGEAAYPEWSVPPSCSCSMLLLTQPLHPASHPPTVPALHLRLRSTLPPHSAHSDPTPTPPRLLGTWRATLSFDGYELPAKDLLSREEIFAEPTVPGLQKCSVALIPDVGKEGVQFQMRWVREKGGAVREDRATNLRSAIAGGLGYDAIERVEYKADPMLPNPFGVNPNRLSLIFVPGRTLNAERIEIFANAREWEAPSPDMFLESEYVRQVTFSSSRTGVPRQV